MAERCRRRLSIHSSWTVVGVGDVRALGIPPIFKDSVMTASTATKNSAARRGAAVLGARAISMMQSREARSQPLCRGS